LSTRKQALDQGTYFLQNTRRTVILICLPLCIALSAAVSYATAILPPAAHEDSSFNELYSEIFYQNVGNGSAAQIRLRHAWWLEKPRANLYIGAVLERNLNAQSSAPLIENSASPEIGILYHPLNFMSLWTEYRLRCTQQGDQGGTFAGNSDPRAGIALGQIWSQPALSTNVEVYGESLLIPRLSHRPVASAFARFAYEAVHYPASVLSLYSELNEFASSAPDSFGPTRTQVRLGARGRLSDGLWSASLFIYRPWQLNRSATAPSEGLEGLVVVGGQF
jgi:hypothetical protein